MMILQKETDSKGVYYIEEEGTRIAEMTYSKAGEDRIIIDHTEVSPAHSGEGLGKLLVLEAVKQAREKQIKIIPLCRFAKAVFARDQSLADVL